MQLLRQFLDSKADVNHTTQSKGRSPLIEACEEGYADIVEALLDANANTEYVDMCKMTALGQCQAAGALRFVLM